MSSNDEMITFSTSDDPPINLKASRSTLVADSTVFRDMLSSPALASDNPSIPVSETAEELGVFLDALANEEELVQNNLHSYRTQLEAQWLALARLSDSVTVRRLVERHIWSVNILVPCGCDRADCSRREKVAKDERSGFAFSLAVNLRSNVLITATVTQITVLQDSKIDKLKVDQIWKDRIVSTDRKLTRAQTKTARIHSGTGNRGEL
jgi:hypothetical protein